MMIGERNSLHPMVHVPPWPSFSDNQVVDVPYALSPNSNANASPRINGSVADDYSFCLQDDGLASFQRYLPSNTNSNLEGFLLEDFDSEAGDAYGKDLDLPVDAYSCDQFRMFEFKVKKCTRGRSHDWTECPYAHPGEKARRRDPASITTRALHVQISAKEIAEKVMHASSLMEFFECWLHPARYRTQPCKDGRNCKRRVCFFAHSPDQLRVLSPRADSYDGSPHRLAFEGSCGKTLHFVSSPESGSPPSESPPMSPMTTSNSMNSLSRSLGSNSINEIVASLRQLQLNKVKSMPSSWGLQMSSPGVGSPRLGMARPGFCSLPSTPTRALGRPGMGCFDAWDKGRCEEEPVMERVESGRDLRARMFERLSKENRFESNLGENGNENGNPSDVPNPDVGWVSDLIQ